MADEHRYVLSLIYLYNFSLYDKDWKGFASRWLTSFMMMTASLRAKILKYIFFKCNLYLSRQVSLEQILIYNDGLPRPNPNPDDVVPIVRRLMGLPITASCDTAWNWTRVCRDASNTEMPYLRPLRHSSTRSHTISPITATVDITWFDVILSAANDL